MHKLSDVSAAQELARQIKMATADLELSCERLNGILGKEIYDAEFFKTIRTAGKRAYALWQRLAALDVDLPSDLG